MLKTKKIISNLLILFLMFTSACNKAEDKKELEPPSAYLTTKSISYNGVEVDLVIDKPALNEVDVLLVFHGTVAFDAKILEAAQTTLDAFKRILNRTDMMIVSVAYPEENLLMGDNIQHAEAALLWLKNKANQDLGITIKKIFLAGHSQGAYLATRLNTLHTTNGVIANGPGPLNLVYRCGLEEKNQTQKSIACTLLKNTYGTTSANPDAYFQRSLLNFTEGFKADILFVQGLNDSPIQLYSWPKFKEDVMSCKNCKNYQFLDLSGYGHTALFDSPEAKEEFNRFIDSR